MTHPLNTEAVRELHSKVCEAESILLLGDNAGETVFDKILIEQFGGSAKVVYAAKGGAVINDATLDDAVDAGLQSIASLIDNGTDAPGTVLSQVSPEFRRHYDQADVVIAKGQANFETLNPADREIFFLTQIKCPVIAGRYGYNVGDWVVMNSSRDGRGMRARAGSGIWKREGRARPA
jgi:hypothetical protein